MSHRKRIRLKNLNKTPSRDKVTFDPQGELSLLSLSEKARLAALANLEQDAGVRAHVLGLLGDAVPAKPRRAARAPLPDSWNQIHVLDRFEEAFEVLLSLPMTTRPKAYGNAMPTIAPEARLSLFEQVKMLETGQLEELHAERNRARISPTAGQITRMDQALAWPAEHLLDQPEMARALLRRCFWTVTKTDVRRKFADDDDYRAFNDRWHEALAIVTGALNARLVPVT